MAYFVQNSSLIIFLVSVFSYLVPPTQKLAWNGSKSPKIREKWRFPGKRKWFRENGSDHEIGNWILIQKKSIWGHFWEIFIQSWKKMTIYGSIFGGQNQKNGHSSLPEAPNAKPNTDSESTSKNTSKKIGLKKVFITPTQNIGDFRFLTNLSLCSLVLAMKMIDSIGSMISRAKGHGSCLSAPDFSISVPVSRKLTPK